MIFIYKNRGILVPVYLIVPFVGTAILSGVLKRNVGGVFASDYDVQIVIGISFLISGIWTYLVKDDYIKANGEKKKIEMNNHLYYLSIKIWSYIMLVIGVVLLILGIIKTIE